MLFYLLGRCFMPASRIFPLTVRGQQYGNRMSKPENFSRSAREGASISWTSELT